MLFFLKAATMNEAQYFNYLILLLNKKKKSLTGYPNSNIHM